MQLPMTSKRLISLISGVVLMGTTLFGAAPALADQAPDKNGPGVTRVSVVQGSVVVQRGDSDKQQVAAVVNAPLLPGDYVSTGGSSRGELQFDGSTALRLGGNVQARITNDDPNNRQLQLADGTVELGIVHAGEPVQIDTPSVTVRAHAAGDYRVSIGKDGSSWVTVRRGSAEFVTPQQTYTLDSGRTLVARGSASNPSITYTTEVGYDTFDDFNAKRDQTMVAALQSSPNLNPDIAGYDNLGAYGQWQNVPGYGDSWIPNQSSNWSPYGDGSWSWEDGYGWTWVANEPWGWAPYHYGRWYYANNYGWAWAPPAYSSYPAWSPALVGFFGFGVGFGGAGWGVSLGFGSGGYGGYGGYGGFGYPYLGWYPLAPYAPYYPWYPGWAWNGYGWGLGGWGGYGWGRNVVRVTNITNIYRYFPHGGVHGVAVGHLRSGNITGHTFRVNQHNITGHVGMIHGGVPITPTRENLGFGGHRVNAPVRLSRAFDSPRFASANRAFAGRMQFDQQARGASHEIQTNAGRANAPVSRGNTPHENASRDASRINAPRDNVPRDNAPRGNVNGGGADRGSLEGRRDNAPTSSWARFNQDRGSEGRVDESRGNGNAGSRGRSDAVSPGRATFGNESPRNGATRENRAPSDSWSRFSNQRGNVSASYDRGAYDRASYNRGSYASDRNGNERSAYERTTNQRNPYASYSRNATPSYSRSDTPSYGRSYGSYGRGSAPSYSRGSYPSYSRGSAPSYSRGSAPSYSRGSYPSYSRGSAPAPSRGYSAPRSSGGGGSGGGGGGHHGGRPPQ